MPVLQPVSPKVKRVYGDFVKQNQYVEIRVRIPDVHSYLDPLTLYDRCICIALKGDYLKVGAPVQASFENPVDTRRGYIINSQNVTGDGSQAESKDEPDVQLIVNFCYTPLIKRLKKITSQ